MHTNRSASFRLHVAPLFREVDVAHMKPMGLDLSKYESVKESADAILERLQDEESPMPPKDSGGPWPDEWIALFARWVREGKKP